MKSYDDYHIYDYEVDSVSRKISFKLVWPENDGKSSVVNILFEGVFGHELKYFRGQNTVFANIALRALSENAAGYRQTGSASDLQLEGTGTNAD